MLEATLVVDFEDSLRRVGTIGWSQTDASLYIRGFGPKGEFNFGQSSIPAGQQSDTISIANQLPSTSVPHLSLHDSGQVHVKKRRQIVAGPMIIPRLADLRGEHAATITCVRFDALALLDREVRTEGERRDVVIRAERGLPSGRFVLYINGEANRFAVPRQPYVTLTLERPTLVRPLYVGIVIFGQERLDREDEGSGVILISGWDPTKQDVNTPGDYLFVIAK